MSKVKQLLSEIEQEAAQEQPRATDGTYTAKQSYRPSRGLMVLVVATVLFATGSYYFNKWSESWHLSFQNPIRVTNHEHTLTTFYIQNFIVITPVAYGESLHSRIHSLSKKLFPEAYAAAPEVVDPKRLNSEQYIRYVFGKDATMALAISHAENGRHKCDLLVAEPNNTVSVGLFQMNTVHFGKYSVGQLITCHGNIDAAYKLFSEQGWGPWSTYKNGKYLKSLNVPW